MTSNIKYTGDCCVETPIPLSEVDEHLKNLDYKVDDLRGLINDLEKRLGPVLKDYLSEGEAVEKLCPALSPLAGKVKNTTDNVKTSCYKIENLINRLAI